MSVIRWLLHNYGEESLCQGYGQHPTTVRHSDHYNNEYVYSFVERWDLLINWPARTENEARFIADKLKQRNITNILDSATGTGFDSIQLIQEGFRVTSMDGNYVMLQKARQNAKKRKVKLNIIHSDWRGMRKELFNHYDAVICMGNSISHLFKKEDQLKSLSAFYSYLKPNGILIIDHLNYDRIFKTGAFDKPTLYFAGKNVDVGLEYFDTGLMRFSYKFPLNWTFFLHFFPILEGQLKGLLSTVGFKKIRTYGNFNSTYDSNDTEYYVYVAEKCL